MSINDLKDDGTFTKVLSGDHWAIYVDKDSSKWRADVEGEYGYRSCPGYDYPPTRFRALQIRDAFISQFSVTPAGRWDEPIKWIRDKADTRGQIAAHEMFHLLRAQAVMNESKAA